MKLETVIHLNFHYDTDKKTYVLDDPVSYYSKRYHVMIVAEAGFPSDGASGPAEDIVSLGWWIHDWLCAKNLFTGWQRSMILHDILLEEGRWFRARSWFVATLLREARVKLFPRIPRKEQP